MEEWEGGEYVFKGVRQKETAGLVRFRTRMIRLWGGKGGEREGKREEKEEGEGRGEEERGEGVAPLVTHLFEREDGALFYGMTSLSLQKKGEKEKGKGKGKGKRKVKGGEEYAMINEGGKVKTVVDKGSQGLREFSGFLKEVVVGGEREEERMVVEGGLLLLFRRLLGIGDPALRNILVREDGKVC